jgi:hypothetical protein
VAANISGTRARFWPHLNWKTLNILVSPVLQSFNELSTRQGSQVGFSLKMFLSTWVGSFILGYEKSHTTF